MCDQKGVGNIATLCGFLNVHNCMVTFVVPLKTMYQGCCETKNKAMRTKLPFMGDAWGLASEKHHTSPVNSSLPKSGVIALGVL